MILWFFIKILRLKMKKKNINKEESEPYVDNLIISDDSDDERSNKIINDINNYSILFLVCGKKWKWINKIMWNL